MAVGAALTNAVAGALAVGAARWDVADCGAACVLDRRHDPESANVAVAAPHTNGRPLLT